MAKTSENGNLLIKVTGIFLVLLGSAVAYGILCGNVSHNTKVIEVMQPKAEERDRKITILETRQTEIYLGVKRIESKLDALP